MQNPRLATRYAKSMIDLATEQNQLAAVYGDMKQIIKICKSNPDFVAMLRSPVIKADKKGKIVEAVLINQVGKITEAFNKLLVAKGRESNLPEIAAAFVTQYNKINGISNVKITTAVAISDATKDQIINTVKSSGTDRKFELETVVDASLIGGFLVETEGNLVDISILRDLKDISKQFLNNDYIHKIR
jgi:F-type H+-transporting ATPase subunit delta